jgi:glycosyltransferase involved in cell wall biosynthesis
MRILYHHRIRSKDGQYVHLEEITEALRNLGHEIILVGPSIIESSEFGSDAGVTAFLKRALPRFLYEFLEFCYSFLAYKRLRTAIRRHKPDCIYERCNLFQVAGAWAKRRYRLPMLLEINAPLLEERERYGGISLSKLARWSQAFVWRTADFVLPVTEVLAGYVRGTGVPEHRIVVIPNGVNPNRFKETDCRHAAKRRLGLDRCLVLGFTGFVREWHGLDRVLHFIARNGPTERLHLLLVGDGPARRDLEQLAVHLGITGSVTITGVIPRDRVSDYIRTFDVALQPAVVPYASPLKLFEYMVLGCAIVAPNLPNIREILTDNENAVLFGADSPDSFSTAVARVCADSDLRERIGACAAKTIEEKGLTWETNARKIVDLYQALRTIE